MSGKTQNIPSERASAINDRPVPLVLQTLIYSLLGRQLPSHCCIPGSRGCFFSYFPVAGKHFHTTSCVIYNFPAQHSRSRSGMEVTRENASQTIHIYNKSGSIVVDFQLFQSYTTRFMQRVCCCCCCCFLTITQSRSRILKFS